MVEKERLSKIATEEAMEGVIVGEEANVTGASEDGG